MPKPGITLNATFYSYDSLLEYSGEEEVLLFCRQWLQGTESFEVFTSGSTGTPKSITLSRKQMLASAAASRLVLKPEEDEHILLSLSPSSIGGKMSLVRAMEWQVPITVIPPSAQPFDHLEKNHPFTLCSLVPLQLHDILKDEMAGEKLEGFRHILLGGAGIDSQLSAAIQKLSPLIYHTYGMTETCSHIALKRLNGNSPQEHFHPVPGVSVSLSEEETLQIEAESAITNPLVTNDLARINKDGSFDILGRKDRTINSGGIKIQLDEMENLFAPHLPDCPFFCAGLNDERLGQKLVLFLENEPFATHELMQVLKAAAPAYKAPKAIIFAPRFLRTATGKIDRLKTSQQWAKTN